MSTAFPVNPARPASPYFLPDRDLVRAALAKSGRTREQIAARARVSFATLNRILAGKPVHRLSAFMIAKALGVKRDEIELKPAATSAA